MSNSGQTPPPAIPRRSGAWQRDALRCSGGRELILIAAFVVLMVGVGQSRDLRPSARPKAAATELTTLRRGPIWTGSWAAGRSRPHPGRPPLIQAVVRQETKR